MPPTPVSTRLDWSGFKLGHGITLGLGMNVRPSVQEEPSSPPVTSARWAAAIPAVVGLTTGSTPAALAAETPQAARSSTTQTAAER